MVEEDIWTLDSMDTGLVHFPEFDCPFMVMPMADIEDGDAEGKSQAVVAGSSCAANTNDKSGSGDVVDPQEIPLRITQDGSGNTDPDASMMAEDDHLPVNPLLFPDVIKDVLSYLPASDVESCRLVCRPWNTEACKVLKNKRIVVFTEAAAVNVYLNAMRDTVDFPHAQFEFCIQDFTGLLDENLRDFWQIFGPHIKNLDFRQTHLYWRDFLEVLEEKVPNLEKLGLRHLPRNIQRRAAGPVERPLCSSVKMIRIASLPNSQAAAVERLADLIKSFPNLEVIEFLPMKEDAESKVSDIFVEILQIPEISLPNLKSINLKMELNNDGVEALASKRIPLQDLQLTLTNGVKATSFKDLIISLRASLTELKITFPDSFLSVQSFSAQNRFMKPEECVQFLSNLKSLKMTNFGRGSINFVHKLPALENLEFAPASLAHSIPFGFKTFRGPAGNQVQLDHHLKLKVLKVTPKSSNINLAETLTLESIARCFPYLNCLYLPGVDDDGLGIIYRNLPFLSEVELLDGKCTDQGLTGIPQEICKDMLETSTYIVVKAELYRRDLFIGSLQFLKKLSLVGSQISDASVALGLADCKNLKELAIGSPMITDTGVIFITDKFFKQLDTLDVTECTEITEQSKFYAREKLVGNFIEAVRTGQENQPWKPTGLGAPHNADRGTIKLKKSSFCGLSSSTKFTTPDSSFFFEEPSETDLRERGLGLGFFPPQIQPRRHRINRIREALRLNSEFMRSLQRMGLQQFRRLFRRELPEARGRENRENQIRAENHFDAVFNAPPARNLIFIDPVPRRFLDPDFVGGVDLMFQRAELRNGVEQLDVDEGAAGDNNQAHLLGVPRPPGREAMLEEDDGGPVAADDGPNRLPENHIAEILRLGLRLEDVEFWLRNRILFEREENGNLDQQVLRERGDAAPAHIMQAFAFDAPPGFLDDDDDFELEDIRRAVMNAIGDDHPVEG